MLLAIARDPRIQGTVTDIVVEFGSSRYQDLIDRFVRGDAIADAALRRAWQDTVTAGVTNDGPYVEEFYRAIRALNATLPKEKRYRVIGGDPPIDWDNVTTKEDLRKWTVRRDSFTADVIHREVAERGRRALVVVRTRALSTEGGRRELRHVALAGADDDEPARGRGHQTIRDPFRCGKEAVELQPDIASWPPMSLTLVRGTVLGAADFTVFNGDND